MQTYLTSRYLPVHEVANRRNHTPKTVQNQSLKHDESAHTARQDQKARVRKETGDSLTRPCRTWTLPARARSPSCLRMAQLRQTESSKKNKKNSGLGSCSTSSMRRHSDPVGLRAEVRREDSAQVGCTLKLPRDSQSDSDRETQPGTAEETARGREGGEGERGREEEREKRGSKRGSCLLYTSDAADDM
eukprot:3368917-Rhodomonas_salina.1